MPWIRHVHVSDKTRVAPGESGKDDYRPFFAVLKRGGYDGLVSVEANGFDNIAGMGPRVLSLLKRQGIIDVWHDRRIGAGQDFCKAIDDHVETDDLILLLVSADFLDPAAPDFFSSPGCPSPPSPRS